MTTEFSHPLCDEMHHWHQVIQLRYKQFLEGITALELVQAEEALETFAVLLHNNLGYMKNKIDALENDDTDTLSVIAADQLILRRTLTKIKGSVSELNEVAKNTPKTLRSVMVAQLDIYVRLANILANHHVRIEEVVFPTTQKSITAEDGLRLAKELANEMRRGSIEPV